MSGQPFSFHSFFSKISSRRFVASKIGQWIHRALRFATNANPEPKPLALQLEALEDRQLLSSVTVNNVLDISNGDTSSISALNANDGGDGISLREAITATNQSAGADTIEFDAATFAIRQTISIGSQLPTITDDLIINGTGASFLKIDAGHGEDGVPLTSDGIRIFEIVSINRSIDVTLNDLTLTGSDSSSPGGAIYNQENLSLIRVEVDQNYGFFGGGVYNVGTLNVTNSTFSHNSSRISGAVYNPASNSVAAFTGVTFFGNYSSSYGGAIRNSGTLSITDSTIVDNTAQVSGGGIQSTTSFTVANTIIANNTATNTSDDDVSGTVTASFSVIGSNEGATITDDGGNQIGTDTAPIDPQLSSLANFGGPTPTMLPLPTSPVIDAGFSNSGSDQRGAPRPADILSIADQSGSNGSDIGAAERQILLSITSSGIPQVSENTLAVLTVTGDKGDGTVPSFSIPTTHAAPDSHLFQLTADNQLQFKTAPDFETPNDADGDNVYQVTIEANDGGTNTLTQIVRVSVTPVNDNPPVFTSPSSISVTEEFSTLAVVLEAEDADLPTQDLVFSLTGNGIDNGLFLIADTNELRFNEPPNFEAPIDDNQDNVYEVTVQVDDQNGNAVSQSIQISVVDAINEPPVFTSATNVDLPENIQAVHTLTVLDEDVGDTATFSIVHGGSDNEWFEIVDGDQLRFIHIPDYERPADSNRDNVYEVSLRAEDSAGNTDEQTILIAVSNVDDNVLQFAASNAFLYTDEDIHERFNDVVATLVASDADDPDQFVYYSLAGNGIDNDKFFVDGRNGELRFVSDPDYENPNDADGDNIYNIILRADSANGDFTTLAATVVLRDVLDEVVVTTALDETEDNDTLSLREALAIPIYNFSRTLKVSFAPSLAGSTIVLTQGEIAIDNTVSIDGDVDGDGKADITISGDIDGSGTPTAGDTRHFRLQKLAYNEPISFANLNLVGGYANQGGSIFVESDLRAVRLDGVTFEGNTAIGEGGAVYSQVTIGIYRSLFTRNTSSRGGAIFGSNIYIRSSTLHGNTAGEAGAIWASHDLDLKRVTVTGNQANDGTSSTYHGAGGILVETGDVLIENSVVAENDTFAGGAPDLELLSGTSTQIAHSLIGDPANSNIESATQTNNLLDIDPMLGALQDNGGATLTRVPLVGSPVIDAGLYENDPIVDQRGLTRVVDFTHVLNGAGNGQDIGAVERQPIFSGTTVTTAEDVIDDNDSVTSLREAIIFANATPGIDKVEFDSTMFNGELEDIIRLTLGELWILDDLQLDGGTTGVVISGDANGDDVLLPGTSITDVAASLSQNKLADNSRVVRFEDIDGVFEVTNVTVTGGSTYGSFSSGAGIDVRGSLLLDNSLISGNASGGNGGGVAVFNTKADHKSQIANSTISNNLAENDAGGLYINAVSGTAQLVNSVVQDNQAESDSGGIDLDAGSGIIIEGSSVIDNTASDEYGGARLSSDFGNVLVQNSTISGNVAGSRVGGLAVVGHSGATVSSVTVSGNQAALIAGLVVVGKTGDLSNSTITKNIATGSYGGASFNTIGPFEVQNSIVAGNQDGEGTPVAPDLYMFTRDPQFPTSISYSLIGDNAGFDIAESSIPDVNGNLVGGGNNGTIDPLLGQLSDNGGLTPTHALLDNSPAIDAGSPESTIDVDQRGFDRIADGNNDQIIRADMGAFEYSADDFQPDTNDDTLVTLTDVSVTTNVLQNDLPKDRIKIDSVTQPSNGSIIVDPDGTVTYSPETGYTGEDSFKYTARLKPDHRRSLDTTNRDQFGSSVDIDDNFAIVGARLAEDPGQPANSGLAYIYQRVDGIWTEVAKLKAPDPSFGGPGDLFGGAVRIDGDTAVVGAIRADQDGIADTGAVYVFQRHQGGENAWGLVTRINNPAPAASDLFGISIAIERDTIVVGSMTDDHPSFAGTNHGSVSIFDRHQGGDNNWGLVTSILNTRAGDRFGVSVDLDGDLLAIGSDGTGAQNEGSVFIFRRDSQAAESWKQVTEITNPKPFLNDKFGRVLSLSDGFLAVGNPLDDRDNPQTPFSGTQAGSVFVFKNKFEGNDPWQLFAELGSDVSLDSIDGERFDRFGTSVSMAGNRILVGAPATNAGSGARGIVYEFTRVGSKYVQTSAFQPSGINGGDRFGRAVAASGQRGIIGSPLDDFLQTDDGSVVFVSTESSTAIVRVTVESNDGNSANWQIAFHNGTNRAPRLPRNSFDTATAQDVILIETEQADGPDLRNDSIDESTDELFEIAKLITFREDQWDETENDTQGLDRLIEIKQKF